MLVIGSRGKFIVIALLLSLRGLMLVRSANSSDDIDDCMHFVLSVRLDRFSPILMIDNLIKSWHSYKKWDALTKGVNSTLEYTIDLTCFEHLTGIEYTHEIERFIDMLEFTIYKSQLQSGSSGFMKIDYSARKDGHGFGSFTARILLENVQAIQNLVLKSDIMQNYTSGCFSVFSSLTSLNLQGNGVVFLSPATFEGLDQLTHLNLSNNELIFDFEPNLFVHLKKLTHLDLSQTTALFLLRPGCFNGLDNLQYLNLSITFQSNPSESNRIERTIFSGLRSLRILDLSHNIDLYFSEDCFDELENLTDLIITDMPGRNSNNQTRPNFYFKNNIVNLDLSSALVEGDWKGQSIDNIRSFTKLKKLFIRQRRLEVEHLVEENFPRHSQLEHLDLAVNMLTSGIFKKLAFLNDLKVLKLGNNNIDLLDQPMNISTLPGLTELHLNSISKCWLNVSHFIGLENLTVLVLASNRIERLTVRSFAGLGRLENLSLANNFIQIIENGTFSPLTSLTRLDLTGNSLRHLYFYGISFKCTILHDGLNVYNMSFIDLGQMGRGRDRSFLHKTLHLRNFRRLKIYRNIQVSWRSAHESPDCSLYFHVLRKYRVISFDLDQFYIEACMNEELNLVSKSFFQEELAVIENLRSYSLLMSTPPGIDFHCVTSDGFLVGIKSSAIVLVNISDASKKHTFQLVSKPDEIILLSDEFLISRSNLEENQTVWNMTDRSNMIALFRIRPASWVFLFFDKYILTVEANMNPDTKDIFCIYYLSGYMPSDFNSSNTGQCQSYEKVYITNIVKYRNDSIAASSIYSGIHMWQLENEIDESTGYPRFLSTFYIYHNELIDSWIVAPNGIHILQLKSGQIERYLIGDEDYFVFKRLMPGKMPGRLVLFKSQLPDNDTLIACLDANVITIWSVRYVKQIHKISVNFTPKRFFSWFHRGLLIIDQLVYEFVSI